ncbi:MAG: hypothetical protein P1V97_32450 [Planctomycetota bacterium]|nr:hypothetical protein [Planctomycetota bacterium]
MTIDHDSEDLRRRVEMDPKNESLKIQYLRTLSRAGNLRQARDFLLTGYSCSKSWENLGETDSEVTRHCSGCRKSVHFTWSIDQLIDHSRQGHCVAAPRHVLCDYLDRVVQSVSDDPNLLKSHACIFETGLRQVTRGWKISHETTIFVRGDVAREYRVIPVGRRRHILILAVSAPLSRTRKAALKNELRAWTIEFLLASPKQIDDALSLYYPAPPRPEGWFLDGILTV